MLILLMLLSIPEPNDWICQASHTRNLCSVMVWHKDKITASNGAIEFCEESCGIGCQIESCWQAKKGK